MTIAFAITSARTLLPGAAHQFNRCARTTPDRTFRRPPARAAADQPFDAEDFKQLERSTVEQMRARLEGLFGASDDQSAITDLDNFDGDTLRSVVRQRWGVEYDVQPQKRGERVYVQIMWRYFEQQSFYMDEPEFASHCEAVAQLLRQWGAVEYFCDYIASTKKRPVVGITINIPIPGVDATTAVFEEDVSS
ncbi:hypothetical protein BWQ96_03912 [Gracilariopsis chorda]|uniref:Uncharacterized protein n=1 Tax=Gracilariopsis chorda TaxID=448386 RepID=A0A2V3IVT1_9FLOR|nr:hypothetical protein BWQ96_03912 [Gracilariopsis chorda]|eukprot:PXF46256.1 hypothetical protein BWQ96_03912 [Gracilariopsis chorda]